MLIPHYVFLLKATRDAVCRPFLFLLTFLINFIQSLSASIVSQMYHEGQRAFKLQEKQPMPLFLHRNTSAVLVLQYNLLEQIYTTPPDYRHPITEPHVLLYYCLIYT